MRLRDACLQLQRLRMQLVTVHATWSGFWRDKQAVLRNSCYFERRYYV